MLFINTQVLKIKFLNTKNNFKNEKKFNEQKNLSLNMSSKYKYNIFLNGENRAKRIVTNEDRYAILQKPLGIILEEGDDNMVFIAKIDPAGNAATSGFDIRVGDVITAVSATFGDEIWSTRGVGLDRVLKSIKIRSGDFVTLVLEAIDENESQKTIASKNAEERRKDAREKFGEPVILDPITLTPINQENLPNKKGFFDFFN
jgi:C-terminal processing protease CtpA/Prc|mmetsp:Transcript_8991/g.13126  ORF Transcript_8991/g.13126 Transcript_8991/m.13126 type:complete len:202 (-) Transcript_8991:229-834(-)